MILNSLIHYNRKEDDYLSKHAVVLCFNSQKGGVGKSVLSYNFAVYEALHHKKVLYIDTDFQKNSTSNFNHVSNTDLKNCCIYRAFQHDSKDSRAPFPANFKPVHVEKNIDLMSSSSHINDAKQLMDDNKKSAFAPYVFLHVFTALNLIKKYDVIIIDTHNSMNLATINAMVVSDYIISPITPNRYGINAMSGMANSINQLKQSLLDPVTQRRLVTCKLLFVGNLVNNTTKLSKEFTQVVKHNSNFVASFPARELFNKSTTLYLSIFDLANKNYVDKKIVNNIIVPQFKHLEKAVIK